MDLFNRENLRELAQTDADVCVSLYMPTFRFESEVSQNPIRFKNLIKQARTELKELGHSDSELDELLAPAHRQLENSTYWHDQSDGLAMFLTENGVRFYRLPLHFEELVVTGNRFHLKPLFPIIASNNRFYLLTLSQNKVRLFQGTHYSISEVETHEIPKSMLDALAYEEEEESLQHHTTGGEAGGEAAGDPEGIIHGQGVASEDKRRPKDKLVRFFRDIDQGVQQTLEDENTPLLLAGVEYYLPFYREVNSYTHLVEDQIVAGNPDGLSPKELQQKAWELMEPLFLEEQENALDAFRQLRGNGEKLASDELTEIVPASFFSRIDTAFVPIEKHLWGNYDSESNTVEVHGDHEVGDEDLLDFVAVFTYLNGGTVHALRPENMPTDKPLAATFRYLADVSASEQHPA